MNQQNKFQDDIGLQKKKMLSILLKGDSCNSEQNPFQF